MPVGFIGLGTMGAHMARSLQRAGNQLVVHDARKEAADSFVAAGAKWAATPAELAAACEVIFTSLPGPPEVEAVALGPEGLLAGVKQGDAWFDMSTNSPTLIKRLAALFEQKGAHLCDSPVSGGPKGAETGKLAIWVGGDKGVFDQHKALLDAMGDAPAYIGGHGSATVAKLVHNCIGYMITCSMAEVFSMGVKAGVDPLTLFQAIRYGVQGRRPAFDGMIDQFLPNKYDPPAFALKLAHKDVGLATALGRELGVPMRIANLTLEEMTEALGRGWGGRDSRSVMLLAQERAGVKIAVDPEKLKEAVAKR